LQVLEAIAELKISYGNDYTVFDGLIVTDKYAGASETHSLLVIELQTTHTNVSLINTYFSQCQTFYIAF